MDVNHFDELKKCCPKGTQIVIVYRGSSKSGMARWFDVYVPNRNQVFGNALWRYTVTAGELGGFRYDRKREALRINGCGFSAADEICRELAKSLYGEYDALTYQEI